jgi:hypothetical protein
MMGGGHWNMPHQHPWNGSSTLGGSNMSLNMPQHGYDQNSMWNPWLQQQQFPMMPMMPGGELENEIFFTRDVNLIEFFLFFLLFWMFIKGMASRSRNHSRAASPALSVRSRRSMMSSRSRQKYQPQDLTDDEDSDIEEYTDDSRSRSKRPASVHGDMKNRMRRRNNSETLELDHRDTEVISRIQRMKEKSKFIRERRSGSLTNWPRTKDRDSGSLSPSDDEIRRIATKHRKSSLTSPTPQSKLQHSMSSSSNNKKKSTTTHSDSASDEYNKKEKTRVVDELKQREQQNSSPKLEEKVNQVSVATPEKSHINGVHVVEMKLDEKTLKSENRPLKVVSKETSDKITTTVTTAKTSTKDEKIAQIKLVDWECEHCTFVNEATATVCTICCKTRVEVLKTLPTTVDEEEEVELDIKQINESIQRNENDGDLKQKGKVRKISFLPGTKAH